MAAAIPAQHPAGARLRALETLLSSLFRNVQSCSAFPAAGGPDGAVVPSRHFAALGGVYAQNLRALGLLVLGNPGLGDGLFFSVAQHLRVRGRAVTVLEVRYGGWIHLDFGCGSKSLLMELNDAYDDDPGLTVVREPVLGDRVAMWLKLLGEDPLEASSPDVATRVGALRTCFVRRGFPLDASLAVVVKWALAHKYDLNIFVFRDGGCGSLVFDLCHCAGDFGEIRDGDALSSDFLAARQPDDVLLVRVGVDGFYYLQRAPDARATVTEADAPTAPSSPADPPRARRSHSDGAEPQPPTSLDALFESAEDLCALDWKPRLDEWMSCSYTSRGGAQCAPLLRARARAGKLSTYASRPLFAYCRPLLPFPRRCRCARFYCRRARTRSA